jgi:hypothetical protein
VGFFAFWLINIVCCRLVLWLAQSAQAEGCADLSGTPGG